MATCRKTIDDLPHFCVSAVVQGQTRETGDIDFELSGGFDKLDGVSAGRCCLLLPGKDVLTALTGDLTFLDLNDRTAVYRAWDKSVPEVAGVNLAYLASPWEPHHVWMVIERRWRWSRTLYRAADVTSRKIRKDDISIVDGQEVREWVEIRKAGKQAGLSRYYPVFPDGRINLPPAGADGVIQGGWDHEHCELCDRHIDAGKYGYLDLGEHWVCEACYNEYVANHDLSFINK